MRFRNQGGTVTAESAFVLPLVAAFAIAMVWMVTVVIAQVQTVDAARDGARAVARGDDTAAAVEQARRTAPAGAEVEVTRVGSAVTMRVTVQAQAPGWLFVPLPAITLGSDATVEVEPDVQSQP